MSKDILSEEDKELFRSFTKDVKPLHHKKKQSHSSNSVPAGQTSNKNFVATTPHPPYGHTLPMPGEKGKRKKFFGREQRNDYKRPEYHQKEEPLTPYFLSDYIKNTVFSETILSYSVPEFPLKEFQLLKKGAIPIEARLDLHGLNSEEASEKLSQFIQTRVQMNKRCVLIIHGKGGYQGQPPVIKNLVNCWLPQINEVLAFYSALAKDGGMGAVYVLLKRSVKHREKQ